MQVTLSGARPDCKQERERIVCRKSCATVGAFVTSLARVYVYKQMLLLLQQGADLLKVNCDSLFFSLPETVPNCLEYSQSFGMWKDIYPGDLLSLCQIGVNNYAVLYKKDAQLISEAKASGLTISHHLTEGLNYCEYLDSVHKMIDEKLFDSKAKVYSQVRKKTDPKTLTVTLKRKKQSVFSRNVLSRRRIVRDLNYSTRPYGWSE